MVNDGILTESADEIRVSISFNLLPVRALGVLNSRYWIIILELLFIVAFFITLRGRMTALSAVVALRPVDLINRSVFGRLRGCMRLITITTIAGIAIAVPGSFRITVLLNFIVGTRLFHWGGLWPHRRLHNQRTVLPRFSWL